MLTFRLKRTIKLGIKSLWMHRLRSALTTSGIIFGVSSVIAMLAIGEGASQHAREQIERFGSQNIIIKTISPPEEEQSSGQQVVREYGLTYADAERFHNSIPNVEVVVPNRILPQRTWYRNRKLAIEVIGTVPWFPDMSTVRLLRGRFFSSIDMHYKQSICVLDENVVTELFAFDDPMYQDVKIATDYYRVVGIVTQQAVVSDLKTIDDQAPAVPIQGGANVGNIYIPLTTIKDRFGEISIEFSGSSGGKIEKVELQEIIVKVGSIEEVLPTCDILETLLDRFHKQDDYQVVVPLELLRQAKRTKLIFSIVLGSIAAISLVVGGIGIMNIMLASVTERTREIGIRRAIGAKRRQIVYQFLIETTVLSTTGGIIGLGMGALIPFLITYFSGMITVMTLKGILLPLSISVTIGILFGLYPAMHAAKIDPIVALRHE